MLKPLLAAAAVFLALPLSARADGPLIVTPTAEWTIEYKKDASAETYTLQPPAGQPGDLAFSRWLAPGNPDQIPGYLDTLTKGFVQGAARNPKAKLESTEYIKGEFIGDPFSGKFVEFTLKNGMKDILFMFGDNSGLWYGHYIGPAAGWNDAMDVIKSIKKT